MKQTLAFVWLICVLVIAAVTLSEPKNPRVVGFMGSVAFLAGIALSWLTVV